MARKRRLKNVFQNVREKVQEATQGRGGGQATVTLSTQQPMNLPSVSSQGNGIRKGMMTTQTPTEMPRPSVAQMEFEMEPMYPMEPTPVYPPTMYPPPALSLVREEGMSTEMQLLLGVGLLGLGFLAYKKFG